MKLNDTSDAELCDFASALPPEQLEWLLATPPLGDDILDHALQCPACAQLVHAATKTVFKTLSPKNRTLISASARRVRSKYDAALRRSRTGMPQRGTLDLAASETQSDAGETPDRVEIAALRIGGGDFKAFEDPEGSVFLKGPIPPGARGIWLGPDAYLLERTSLGGEVKVRMLGSIELEQFLGRHQGGTGEPPIRWSDERQSGS